MTMTNLAGQLGRFCVVNTPFAISRHLMPRSLHSLPCLRTGAARSGIMNMPRNTTSRTKICQIQGNSNLLSNRNNAKTIPESFHLYHTSPNWHKDGCVLNFWRFSSCMRYLRWTSFSARGRASPGLVTACGASLQWCRLISSGQRNAWKQRNRSGMLYSAAVVVLVVGFSYAAVPLYAVFCQVKYYPPPSPHQT